VIPALAITSDLDIVERIYLAKKGKIINHEPVGCEIVAIEIM